MRFRFDYTQSNHIREPDGSVNPALPRIERHTVNTEVQLSSLELRNISRYESNAAVGLPVRRDGGIPGIKEIPFVRDIPLLGYFTRRAGRDAKISQSLIFAQSTVYPTIGALVPLLSSRSDDSGQVAPTGHLTLPTIEIKLRDYALAWQNPTAPGSTQENRLAAPGAIQFVQSPDGSSASVLISDAGTEKQGGKPGAGSASKNYELAIPVRVTRSQRKIRGFVTDMRFGGALGSGGKLTLTINERPYPISVQQLETGYLRIESPPSDAGAYTFKMQVQLEGDSSGSLFQLDSLDITPLLTDGL